jgi:hypothetical protein
VPEIPTTIAAFSTPTLVPVLDVPTQVSLPQNIASGNNIRHIWWSPDSKRVSWLWGTYELETGVSKSLSQEAVMLQTPQPGILAELPPYYLAFPSPSGEKALYIEVADAPIVATYGPEIEGGDPSPTCGQAELYIWGDNHNDLLGTIEHCIPNTSYWIPNESKVVLVQDNVYPPTTKAWIIELQQKSILVLEDSEPGLLQIHGVSPDGEQLLYSYYEDVTGINKLHLFDLNGLQDMPTDAIVHNVGGWIDNNQILVWNYGGEIGADHVLGILNLETLEFKKLLGEGFNELIIGYAALSPDHQYIAFTSGESIHYQSMVWLLKFDGEFN